MFAKLLRYTPMYSAFGFVDSQPIIIGLFIVTMYILIPLNTVSTFFPMIFILYVKQDIIHTNFFIIFRSLILLA